MYVAMTRAKENLYISYPIGVYDRINGITLMNPSRFVRGISERSLERIAVIDH